MRPERKRIRTALFSQKAKSYPGERSTTPAWTKEESSTLADKVTRDIGVVVRRQGRLTGCSCITMLGRNWEDSVMKKYDVTLSAKERQSLLDLIAAGKASAL